jgi:protein phosphatase
MSDLLTIAALSDVGCKRKNNEDSFGFDEAAGIFVVSDGMGGSAAGEVASHLCVKETVETYATMRVTDPALAPHDALYHAVRRANEVVYSTSRSDPKLGGMGATLVAVCFEGRTAIVANVGDSRAYLLRAGACTQITQDHSLIEEQVRLGLMTAEAAAASPMATTITRAMGIGPEVEPDIFAAELLTGDRLLLTTDGLIRHVPDVEIADMVALAGDVGVACSWLIERTKERGAADNVTCLLVEMG